MFPVARQVKAILEEILERVTDEFNIQELMARVEEHTPYVVVALQECERMNSLTREMRYSLRELDLGLKVGEACCRGTSPAGPPWGVWELENRALAAISVPKAVSCPETRVCSCCREGRTQGLEA